MKVSHLLLSSLMIAVSASQVPAEHGKLNVLGRYLGYGISDGYHARGCGMIGCESCSAGHVGAHPASMMPSQPPHHGFYPTPAGPAAEVLPPLAARRPTAWQPPMVYHPPYAVQQPQVVYVPAPAPRIIQPVSAVRFQPVSF